MKKQNLLKLALMMVAMVFMTGAMAQVTQIDHTNDVATGTNYVEATDNTYQTVGIGLRLYVRPDAVYSPLYTGAGNAGTGLNTNSEWTWVSGATYATGAPVKAAANENWVTLLPAQIPAANATTTFWVLESNTSFSCVGAATSHIVSGVATPTADIAGQGNAWDILTAGFAFRRCATGTDIGDVINVAITETGAPVAAQEYTFGISVAQQALDANLLPTGAIFDVTGSYGVLATAGTLVAGLNPTHTIPALPLLTPSTPTQYTFTLTASSIFSNISIRSQLRGGIAVPTGYTGAATTIIYTLLPVPTTGPIFHIPNNF